MLLSQVELSLVTEDEQDADANEDEREVLDDFIRLHVTP
jgi:hypothetical protein